MQPTIPAIRAAMIRKTVAVAISRCLLEPGVMLVLHCLCCIDLDWWGTDLMSSILKELFNKWSILSIPFGFLIARLSR